MRPVGVHDIELRALITEPLIVEAEIGDVLAVGRDHRVCIGPAPIGERTHRAVREIHAVDLGVERLVVPIRPAVGRDVDRTAVGAPGRRTVMVEVAVGELACRTAVRRDHVQLTEARGQVALPVDPIHEAIDELGRVGPGGPLGRLRQLDLQRFSLRGRRHREGEPAAIGRPGEARWRFREMTDRGGHVAAEPIHKQLGRPVARRREIGDAGTVGRPARHARGGGP